MIVDEWADSLWPVLNVRPKTLKNYQHIYKKYLQAEIGSTGLDEVKPDESNIRSSKTYSVGYLRPIWAFTLSITCMISTVSRRLITGLSIKP